MRSRPGFTIYLVLVIGSIFSILFVIALLAVRSESGLVGAETHKIQAKLLAQSGIMRAEYFMGGNEGHTILWETPKFEEPVMDFGSINLVVERFGLFSRVASTGTRRGNTCTVIGLFGRNCPELLGPALTITGHVGGLVLKNGSMIEGNIVLHHGFVYDKKGGKALTDYTRRLSLKESPLLPFDTLLLPALFKQYKERHVALLTDSLFSRKAFTVKGDFRMGAAIPDGMVIAVSGKCFIDQAAKLRNITCYADKIVCEGGTTAASLFFSEKTIVIEGGKHNSQFFACDSIMVKKAASFGRMSVLAGFREEIAKDSLKRMSGGVFIDDNAIIRGAIVCVAGPKANLSNMAPSISFGKNVLMNGSIVTDGDCFISESEIYGRIWARAIVARDAEGSYIDYLIKMKIKRENEEMAFPLIGDAPVRLRVSVENVRYGKTPPKSR